MNQHQNADIFFEYQLVTKKSENPTPYPGPLKPDPKFKDEVFRRAGKDNKMANFGEFTTKFLVKTEIFNHAFYHFGGRDRLEGT